MKRSTENTVRHNVTTLVLEVNVELLSRVLVMKQNECISCFTVNTQHVPCPAAGSVASLGRQGARLNTSGTATATQNNHNVMKIQRLSLSLLEPVCRAFIERLKIRRTSFVLNGS